jgi:23S rRNA pseudouridine2605 synthase
MDAETVKTPTAKDIEAQEIADGHRYRTPEFDDAREAQKPGSEFKKAREAKKAAPKKNLKDANPKGGERIAKVLARAGLASRREIERLVGLGKIAVNGRILETPAVLVNAQDTITVEGRPIGKAEPTRLWRYHKPVGLMTTHSDPQGRPTVFENMPQPMPRVISVGRLDMNSEGLLLLTNDGELARALELPTTGWVRIYRARALGHTSQAQLDRLKNGTTVDGVIYGPMEATLDKKVDKADGRANVWLTVSITEGKNREVRKVLESIGLKVNRLIRLAYGPFQLGNLETGDVEEVGPRVIRELLSDKIDARNLPPEGASQTQDAPRARREGAVPEGRRGGGDRFKAADSRGEKKFGDKPRGPRREFVEKREYKERDFDERPRFEGDGEARDRREWKPRPEGRDRAQGDRKPYGAKSFGDKPTGERAWKPRPEGQSAERSTERKTWTPRPERGGDDRPRFKPREDREGAGERKTYGDKPRFKPREGSEATGERRSYGDRPRFDRDAKPGRPAFKKPYAKKTFGDDIPAGEAGAYERAKREFGGGEQRPRRDFGDRPQGDRPAFKKPYTSREEGGERKTYGKPRFDRDDRPQGDRPAFKKPYAPRQEGDERKSYGKPRFDAGNRPQGERTGGRDFKPREARDDSFGDRPRGPRPAFNRSGESKPGGYKSGGFKGKPSGGRPAGKPGGFAGKPRRED